MPSIEISASGPNIEDGVYPLQLSAIVGDPDQPDVPRKWHDPVKDEDVYFWDWVFHMDDGTELRCGTSTKTGPRSKMFPLLTALLGGRAPKYGDKLDFKDLIGRMVLGTVQRQESGYSDIVSFSAMPISGLSKKVAESTGAAVTPKGSPAPVAPASRPIRDQVDEEVDQLPL
jgi:hypothetical protein